MRTETTYKENPVSSGRSGAIAEVLRTVANETERNKALLNNLDHPVAERRCVSVLYLPLGTAARKTFTDISSNKGRGDHVRRSSKKLQGCLRYEEKPDIT